MYSTPNESQKTLPTFNDCSESKKCEINQFIYKYATENGNILQHSNIAYVVAG